MKLKTYIKYLLLIASTIFIVEAAIAQDPVFSQFYSAKMFLNPALAADHQEMNFTLNNKMYTNQMFDKYSLSQFTVIYPFTIKKLTLRTKGLARSDHRSGAALSIFREVTGDNILNTHGVLVSFAQNIQLSSAHYLSLGLQGAYIDRRGGGDLRWGTQYDYQMGYDEDIIPSLGDIDDLKAMFGVVNAGICWFYNNSKITNEFSREKIDAFAGISLYNINQPKQSFFDNGEERLRMNFKTHGGIKYKVNDLISFFPNLLYVRQNADNQLNLGTYTSISPQSEMFPENSNFSFLVGAWYRVGDAIISTFGFKMYGISCAISYDFNSQSIAYKGRGKGVMEFSVKYTMKPKGPEVQRGLIYPSY